MNFLEQLVAEWYEFNGYFIRRNIRVGLRHNKGGYECELDVVAFHPEQKRLVQIEPSMDSDSWKERERRFGKKFKAGRKYIPDLFRSFRPLPEIEHIALFVFGSDRQHAKVGGGRVLMIRQFMTEIQEAIKVRSVAKSAIPEQYVILRALLFAKEYWN